MSLLLLNIFKWLPWNAALFAHLLVTPWGRPCCSFTLLLSAVQEDMEVCPKRRCCHLLTLVVIPATAYIQDNAQGWGTGISSASYTIWQEWQLNVRNLHVTRVQNVTAQHRWGQSLPRQQWLKPLIFLHVLSGLAARMTAHAEWHQKTSAWDFYFLFPPKKIVSVCCCLNEWLKFQIPQQQPSTDRGARFLPADRSQTSPTHDQASEAQVLFHNRREEVWEAICSLSWDHSVQANQKLCWPPDFHS